ncbi:MAG: xanthine dehydrogenase family protein molybdopterin-binding subunit [Nakamurella sp.]
MTTTEATTAAAPEAEIGRSRTRKEDQHLITGHNTFTDGMTLPGMVHLAMVRSPHARATITSIDVEQARKAPGVIGVWTGKDFPEQGGLICVWPITPDMKSPVHLPVPTDTVNHVGEIVAVIAARSKTDAVDATELVTVDYSPLPAVTDLAAARDGSAPVIHEELGSNVNATWVYDSADAGTGGSAKDAIAAARNDPDQIVVERTLRQQRVIPAYMEPRSTVCDPNGANDQITVWSATQIPHVLRTVLTLSQGIPEHELHIIAPDVGGGFGGKLEVTPEEVVTIMVARQLGKPAKYTETRSECMVAAHHGRDQIQHFTMSARKDGTITGFDVDLTANMGAYLALIGPGIPILGAFMYNGIYKIPAYHFSCTNVFTNEVMTDAYRGAGRPEATFGVERMIDELATELGMDPIELRRKNWITHEEFPFTTVSGMTYDTGNYEAATAKALELFGYDELRAEQKKRRDEGATVQLGIGTSTFTEMCGLAPSRVLGSLSYAAGGWEAASIRMLPTGVVEVITGISPHGQGHVTGFSQIVADRLGVPFENVKILHGDTNVSAKGLDTYGSRSLVVGGIAVVKAADKVIAKAKIIAAHLLEASEDDIEVSHGTFTVRGTESSLTIADISFAVFSGHNLPDGCESTLDSEATYDPENFSFPHGTHLVAVDVDTETGKSVIRRYVAVDDIGTVINPLLVDGQVHGGIAQGIAQALYEEALYSEEGQLTSGSFVDYLVPSAVDLPHYTTDRTVTPATSNPLGVKGVGEAGTIASTPAVVNAVLDAVRQFGVTDVQMPMTPARVWQAIHDAKNGGNAGNNDDGHGNSDNSATGGAA